MGYCARSRRNQRLVQGRWVPEESDQRPNPAAPLVGYAFFARTHLTPFRPTPETCDGFEPVPGDKHQPQVDLSADPILTDLGAEADSPHEYRVVDTGDVRAWPGGRQLGRLVVGDVVRVTR